MISKLISPTSRIFKISVRRHANDVQVDLAD
jgi:hypothetical protein